MVPERKLYPWDTVVHCGTSAVIGQTRLDVVNFLVPMPSRFHSQHRVVRENIELVNLCLCVVCLCLREGSFSLDRNFLCLRLCLRL